MTKKAKSKLFVGLYAISLLTFWLSPQTTASECYGDLDADGKLRKSDVLLLANHLLTANELTVSDTMADMNQDGVLDSVDFTLLKRAVLMDIANRNVQVSDTATLKTALQNAVAGQTILLAPGTYSCNEYGSKGALFASGAEGTASDPITIRSANPDDPAVLSGVDPSAGIVLYLTGDYWQVEGIVCTNAQKGIVLDHSNHSIISHCTVYQIGSEGIHLRDNSSNCTISYCSVHDTGVVSPQYGEAIYIGSAYSTTTYGYDCHDNLVTHCTLGPNVAAEHIDVKEYTSGTIIEYCQMDGAGISGANGGDSFVDLKGNTCTVRFNTCIANGCPNLNDAFQSHSQVEGWGYENVVYSNRVTLDKPEQYLLRIWSGTSCTAYDNTRIPTDGNTYRNYDDSILTILNSDTITPSALE